MLSNSLWSCWNSRTQCTIQKFQHVSCENRNIIEFAYLMNSEEMHVIFDQGILNVNHWVHSVFLFTLLFQKKTPHGSFNFVWGASGSNLNGLWLWSRIHQDSCVTTQKLFLITFRGFTREAVAFHEINNTTFFNLFLIS